mmetsp:Transcript_12854/g.17763  ORF Transcript_12854/g.17763 Transcript_12854/m.17763 type:complete len:84 (-) Transcript_12854:144-395(-)
MTIPEHEEKIKDILKYQWEFHRFCVENKIHFLLDVDGEEAILQAKQIMETGILPDGKPLFWENDKDYWPLAEELDAQDLFKQR